VLAIIWHNSRPRKVGIFIWLTLNCELPVGTWLQCMRIPPTCKVYPDGLYELWQHCLLECVKAKYAWEAYFRVWQKWGALDDIALSWPLILLGDLVVEKEDDPPKIQNYHAGGFSFITQPLDILRSFIFYFLWSKRCRMHFDVQYSSHNVLQQAWVVIVGLGWRTGKPSILLDLLLSLVSRIILIRPLRLNGATWTFLGRMALLLCGTFWTLIYVAMGLLPPSPPSGVLL